MYSSRTVIIIGVNGQDGRVLAESFNSSGVEVVGVSRNRVTRGNSSRKFSVLDCEDVGLLISTIMPDEIYYLAAHHSSSEGRTELQSPEEFSHCYDVHVRGVLNVLWAVSHYSPRSRVFYAATSLLYDGSNGPVQNEETRFNPVGFYGLTKAQGLELCRFFRRERGLFVCSGILYSHESVFRPSGFLSKKILKSAHEIALGKKDKLVLGGLSIRNDWGFASDYTDAFRIINSLPEPDDFVVATGESHSVAEFAELVFQCFGLRAVDHVREDPSLLSRTPVLRIGDSSKLRSLSDWKPKYTFRQMIERLVADYLASLD